LSISS